MWLPQRMFSFLTQSACSQAFAGPLAFEAFGIAHGRGSCCCLVDSAAFLQDFVCAYNILNIPLDCKLMTICSASLASCVRCLEDLCITCQRCFGVVLGSEFCSL